MKLFNKRTTLFSGALLVPLSAYAQSALPEPGVIVYGKVLANDGVQTVPSEIIDIELRFSQDSPLQSKLIEADVGKGLGDQTYFSAQVVFENAAALGSTSVSPQAFAFPTGGTTKNYTLDPNNTNPANNSSNRGSRAVQNNADGSKVYSRVSIVGADTEFAYPEVVDGQEQRGKMIKIDLKTDLDANELPPPPSDTYEEFIANYASLTGADDDRGADPDGDGMANEAEWYFRTDPTNEHSNKALHTFVLDIAPVAGEPNSKDLTFAPKYTDGSRSYRIFSSIDLGESNPWQLATNIPVTDGDEIISGVVEGRAKDAAAIPAKKFYQVEATVNGE